MKLLSYWSQQDMYP